MAEYLDDRVVANWAAPSGHVSGSALVDHHLERGRAMLMVASALAGGEQTTPTSHRGNCPTSQEPSARCRQWVSRAGTGLVGWGRRRAPC